MPKGGSTTPPRLPYLGHAEFRILTFTLRPAQTPLGKRTPPGNSGFLVAFFGQAHPPVGMRTPQGKTGLMIFNFKLFGQRTTSMDPRKCWLSVVTHETHYIYTHVLCITYFEDWVPHRKLALHNCKLV